MNALRLSLVVALAWSAHGEAFEHRPPILVILEDSNAAPVRCAQMALQSGDYVGAAFYATIAPASGCATWDAAGTWCRIVAPVSPGIGQVFAAVSSFIGPDEVLAHELAHCLQRRDFHPPQPKSELVP